MWILISWLLKKKDESELSRTKVKLIMMNEKELVLRTKKLLIIIAPL